MADTDKQDLTITEAAALRGVRRTTIHRAIAEGRIPATAVRVGQARTIWMVKRQDLDQWQPADRAERGRRGAAALHGKKGSDGGGA